MVEHQLSSKFEPMAWRINCYRISERNEYSDHYVFLVKMPSLGPIVRRHTFSCKQTMILFWSTASSVVSAFIDLTSFRNSSAFLLSSVYVVSTKMLNSLELAGVCGI